MAEDKASKKHAATPHKKKEARKKGNVAKSQDIGISAGLLVGFGVVIAMHGYYMKHLQQVMITCFSAIEHISDVSPGTPYGIDILELGLYVLKEIAFLSAPVLFGVLIITVGAQFGMVGFLFTTEQMKPKFEKINPMKGIKKWFSIKQMVELGKSLAKIAVSFALGYTVWKAMFPKIGASILLTPAELMALGGSIIAMLFYRVVILFVVIAVLDYMFQKWQWARDLKMTDKEIRDEYKNQEGDPYMKGKRQQIHRQMSQQAAAGENVPQSDVVVINPTDIAVALKYDPDLSPVPYVLAKGETRLADTIRESARNAGIPVVRNKPLARQLHDMCEVGDIVPPELYRPVAEVIAYVLSLNETSAAVENSAAASAQVASSAEAASLAAESAAGTLNSNATPVGAGFTGAGFVPQQVNPYAADTAPPQHSETERRPFTYTPFGSLRQFTRTEEASHD